MVIYLDVLILLNYYIMYFLLRSTMIFLHETIKTKRLLFASGIAALSSLAILLPEENWLISILLKIGVAVIVVFIAFGKISMRKTLQRLGVFLLLNFIFAGIMLLVQQLFSPANMLVTNGVFYLDISIGVIAVATIVAYLSVKLVRKMLDSKASASKKFTIIIESNKGIATLSALADTGNKLHDPFNSLPVIVCGFDSISPIAPAEINEYVNGNANYASGLRLIPSSSIGGNTLLPAFKPVSITIKDDEFEKKTTAMIGVSKADALCQNSDYQCIFNPNLMI